MSDKQVMVRRSVRHDIAMRAHVSVAPACAQTVRLSPATGVRDGWIEVDAVDCSLGGLGLLTTVFFPRHTVVKIKLFGAGEEKPLVLECDAIVRRVQMTDRRPAYHVGTSFHNLSEEQQRRVELLNAMLAHEA
jgi:hypothetical protein